MAGRFTRAFLLLLTLVGIGYFVLVSREDLTLRWFAIEQVVIHTELPLTEEELRQNLPRLEGKNLLSVSGEALLAKVLKNPWVAGAFIKKEYPNRIILTVQARKPVAVRQESNRLVWLDEKGIELGRWTSVRSVEKDLPVIAFENRALRSAWSSDKPVTILLRMQKALLPKYRISQIVLSDPPFFKVFLTNPPMETLFSLHTWEAQLPLFAEVLTRPPRQIGQAHKINLVFPKKAIVSFPLSH